MVSRELTFLSSFNTQPPEGGWASEKPLTNSMMSFNTQPPEGGWSNQTAQNTQTAVSTHSRPKAAGSCCPTELPTF